ncbi:MAG: Glucosyl-3-phosphoglycerate synthase [Opitutia bacterium UBA7350]|nr:MAG: Glucosyl-3-phosphoglycerate synthase [Opitutae bacterium UBA7350]
MSDFHQSGTITNFHNLATRSPENLEQEVFKLSREKPVGLILPSLYSELEGAALPNIIDVLSEMDYLEEIVIGLDQADENQYRYALEFFGRLPGEVKILWNGGPRLRAIDATLQSFNLAPMNEGKGRNVWYLLGYMLARKRSQVIAIHDCDIVTYNREMLTRLIYPVLNPSLNFSYSKGYYSRIAENRMNGRVCRLLITPLLLALKKICGENDYLEYMDSFKYALSGEFAFNRDIVADIRIPSDWGLEMGMLSEMYRNHQKNKICQVDIANFYDHKHQDLSASDADRGLAKMSTDISKSLFRKLATYGEVFSSAQIRTIKAAYYRTALDLIDSYENDATMNGLSYDRHKEMQSVEVFSESIIRAGDQFLNQPTDTPFIPSWKRVRSAVPDIENQLIEAVEEDMDTFKPKKQPAAKGSKIRQAIQQHLNELYPSGDCAAITDKILSIASFGHQNPVLSRGQNKWTEADTILITYGDTITREGEAPLKTLNRFTSKHLSQTITTLHVLPFFPYSSDDGFSVIDYLKVNPELGNWEAFEEFNAQFETMADLVINHCSQESEWFKNYCAGKSPGTGYFFEVEADFNTDSVVRPRSSPLLRTVETINGTKNLWCTFSHDQIDLNFANPEVLYEAISILKFLVEKGIKYFRLDAIAFLWKRSGSSCVHLKETHEIIKLLRLILENLEPEAVLITETNVPNRENLSYFGNDNEAHLIYNFSLPPLLIHALLKGDSTLLKSWMMSMPPARRGRSYLNFIASHDGIGVRPLEGLISDTEQTALLETLKSYGGTISKRTNPDGRETPYEVNISLFDALRGTISEGPDRLQVERYLCAHTILLALEGIPAFYIHSMLATENDTERQAATGNARSINRHQWELDRLMEKLDDSESHHHQIFYELKRRIAIRKQQIAFHPNATQLTLHLGDQLFAFWRESSDRHQSIFAINNISNQTQTVALRELNLISTDNWRDLLTGASYGADCETVEIPPYAALWITNA